MFVPSASSVLNSARNVPLLMRSRISAYFASIILGQFSLRSFCLRASAIQQLSRPLNEYVRHVEHILGALWILCVLVNGFQPWFPYLGVLSLLSRYKSGGIVLTHFGVLFGHE